MRSISTFNALHLGDNLVHLHFLRKLAQAYPEIHFTHGANEAHLAQLYPLWQDLPNLKVESIVGVGQGAINAWCGAGAWWYQQPSTADWCGTMIRWFHELANLMGLECPIREPRDMLFDYPALIHRVPGGADLPMNVDFLIINSPPRSGQWSGFSLEAFDQLCEHLDKFGRVLTTHPSMVDGVRCTQADRLDVTGIGKLSQQSRVIIGCVTGPMWPCLNIWNADTVKLRIHLQDREHVNMAPNTTHANSLSLVPEILKDRGFL
jgi:hypothetical protein